MLGLSFLGSSISTAAECGRVDMVDLVAQIIAVAGVTYVTWITRKLDKEVRNGGE
jgi:hypothetical protein